MHISESKREGLVDLMRQLENEISQLFHEIENDQSIPNDRFRAYEKMIEKLYYIHNQLNEEIIFG